MGSSLHIQTKVLPGHRIEFSSPELSDGEAVDVVVTRVGDRVTDVPVDRTRLLAMPLTERRRLLAEQAEKMECEYGPDAEREAWQGGEVVE